MFGQSHAFFLDPHGCGVSAIPWVDISRWIAWQATCVACACSVAAVFCSCCLVFCSGGDDMGMDQYLLIPFLVGWTSIYQLFWCSPGVQGFDPLPYAMVQCCFEIWWFPEWFPEMVPVAHQSWMYWRSSSGLVFSPSQPLSAAQPGHSGTASRVAAGNHACTVPKLFFSSQGWLRMGSRWWKWWMGWRTHE